MVRLLRVEVIVSPSSSVSSSSNSRIRGILVWVIVYSRLLNPIKENTSTSPEAALIEKSPCSLVVVPLGVSLMRMETPKRGVLSVAEVICPLIFCSCP